MNQINHLLDGSVVYGNDDEDAKALRWVSSFVPNIVIVKHVRQQNYKMSLECPILASYFCASKRKRNRFDSFSRPFRFVSRN